MFSLSILAASAAIIVTAPVPKEQLAFEYAYVAGRCYVQTSESFKLTFFRDIKSLPQAMRPHVEKVYYAAIKEKQLSAKVCISQLNDIFTELGIERRADAA